MGCLGEECEMILAGSRHSSGPAGMPCVLLLAQSLPLSLPTPYRYLSRPCDGETGVWCFRSERRAHSNKLYPPSTTWVPLLDYWRFPSPSLPLSSVSSLRKGRSVTGHIPLESVTKDNMWHGSSHTAKAEGFWRWEVGLGIQGLPVRDSELISPFPSLKAFQVCAGLGEDENSAHWFPQLYSSPFRWDSPSTSYAHTTSLGGRAWGAHRCIPHGPQTASVVPWPLRGTPGVGRAGKWGPCDMFTWKQFLTC